MGKISAEARKSFTEKVKVYKQQIEQILQREKSILQVIEKTDEPEASHRIALAEDRMNLAALYLLLNRISVSMLSIKNEAFLNDARKSCYECVIHLESVVSDGIDVPFTDLEDVYHNLEDFPDRKRYELLKKLGFTIDAVIQGFGENSKWKWSFVDLHGRFAVVYKNFINFKTVVAGMDPRVEDYQVRTKMVRQVKELLNTSADEFRLKYELSTTRIDDFKQAIRFLAALRRIHIVFGESQDSEDVKKKSDLWKAKMEDDERNRKGDA